MKIIKNNLNAEPKNETMEETCNHCNSILEIEPNDLHEGWLGAYFYTCPVCGKESMCFSIETELPTKDSIEFPKHFIHTCIKDGAIDISDKEIQEEIRRLANGMWNCTNEMEHNTTEYGNAFIFIENLSGDGEYRIVVCKNYWEGSIKANPADECYGGH